MSSFYDQVIDSAEAARIERCTNLVLGSLKRWLASWQSGHGNGVFKSLTYARSDWTEGDYASFMTDLEHGFFHGVVSALLAFTMMPADPVTDPIMAASCFLHDAVRATRHTEECHDQAVRKIFPLLTESAYFHSKPLYVDPLVMADRLELYRFEDAADWVNPQGIAFEALGGLDGFKTWLRYVRPVLQLLFLHRNDLWLRHTVEPPHYIDALMRLQGGYKGVASDSWPLIWWSVDGPSWCVETGFIGGRHVDMNSSDRLLFPASDTDVIGLTPWKSQYRFGYFRDHENTADRIPLSAWLFLSEPNNLIHVPNKAGAVTTKNVALLFVELVRKLDAVIKVSINS